MLRSILLIARPPLLAVMQGGDYRIRGVGQQAITRCATLFAPPARWAIRTAKADYASLGLLRKSSSVQSENGSSIDALETAGFGHPSCLAFFLDQLDLEQFRPELSGYLRGPYPHGFRRFLCTG